LRHKILIIGGNGLVGSTLAKYASLQHDIHLTVNHDYSSHKVIPHTKIDLLYDEGALFELIKNWKPTVVVNTVALSSVDLCETNTKLANQLHVETTKNIVNVCKEFNSKLIHFSTDAVFDGKLDGKYSEKDEPNPINYYGKTRLEAEKIVLCNSNMNVVLRTAVIYGWHERSRFTNWIIPYLKEGKIVDPFTDQFNTPTLVDDLIKSILKIIEQDQHGLFHAVGKSCISRYDFAILLADKFGLQKNLIRPVTSNEKKQDAPRPPKTCLDASKLENLINFEFCTLKEGISYIFEQSKI
jgi:dTDP-4-dehydrorhamnose reductase